MLLVSDNNDVQMLIAYLYLLLEQGAPNTARIFSGGHGGKTHETFPTIVNWLKTELIDRPLLLALIAIGLSIA